MQLVQHIENIKCMRQLLTVSVKKATIVLPSFLLKVQANTYCPLVHPGFIPPGLKEKKKKKTRWQMPKVQIVRLRCLLHLPRVIRTLLNLPLSNLVIDCLTQLVQAIAPSFFMGRLQSKTLLLVFVMGRDCGIEGGGGGGWFVASSGWSVGGSGRFVWDGSEKDRGMTEEGAISLLFWRGVWRRVAYVEQELYADISGWLQK